jgi:hypothetical protein
MPIEVLRVLRYVYPDYETLKQDMQNWQIPANGCGRSFGSGRYIESMVMHFPHEKVDSVPDTGVTDASD